MPWSEDGKTWIEPTEDDPIPTPTIVRNTRMDAWGGVYPTVVASGRATASQPSRELGVSHDAPYRPPPPDYAPPEEYDENDTPHMQYRVGWFWLGLVGWVFLCFAIMGFATMCVGVYNLAERLYGS